MKKLYIVFDQIPAKSSGGLVATYVNLVELLKKEYDIEIISIFECNSKNKEQFSNNRINVINKKNIDMRFYKTFKYLKEKNLKKALYSIYSALYYFFKIPFSKYKLRKLIKGDYRIIVSCPSAAIFMPKNRKFILEFHIDYNYFFGKSILGRSQTMLMTRPKLSLFRSKIDSKKAPNKINPNYIYNFFDNDKIKPPKKIIKNKIVFLGRLSEVKQPLKLVEYAYELRKINKDFTLDIYGEGNLKKEIEEKIKAYNLEDTVFLKGFTNDKNVYSKYSLLWLTSKTEGLPMVIIEAKACAIPTISTNWGDAVFEVINNKKDGYITNNDEEFIRLTNNILTNEKLHKELSDNALKNFKVFSKEKAKKRWINFLENYKK